MNKKVLYYIKYTGMAFSLIAFFLIGTFFIRRFYERQKQLQIISDFENQLTQTDLLDHSYTGAGTSDFG